MFASQFLSPHVPPGKIWEVRFFRSLLHRYIFHLFLYCMRLNGQWLSWRTQSKSYHFPTNSDIADRRRWRNLRMFHTPRMNRFKCIFWSLWIVLQIMPSWLPWFIPFQMTTQKVYDSVNVFSMNHESDKTTLIIEIAEEGFFVLWFDNAILRRRITVRCVGECVSKWFWTTFPFPLSTSFIDGSTACVIFGKMTEAEKGLPIEEVRQWYKNSSCNNRLEMPRCLTFNRYRPRWM